MSDTIEFYRLSAIQGVVMNSNLVPSKKMGRKGTRRAWKRAHPPGRADLLHKYFEEF